MVLYGFPLLYAMFLWWFSTGAIIYLDNLPPRTFRTSMLCATALLPVAFHGLWASGSDTSVTGAYLAFTYALLAWSWLEISFYMGFVTGPRRHACEPGCSGWRHFAHAIAVSLWHELAIIAFAIAVMALTWDAPNHIGKWTFLTLWWMHESARLNVFLGVRNLNEHFVPAHLAFLKSFLTKKPMNLLFPVSVTVSTVVAILLVQAAAAPGAGAFQAVGFTFLAGLMVLAILEHWFLVLPLPAEALWSWSAPRSAGHDQSGPCAHERPHEPPVREILPEILPVLHVPQQSLPWPLGPRLTTRRALAAAAAADNTNTNLFTGRRR